MEDATNIRYADDTLSHGESEEELQRLLNVVVEESENKGLTINCEKTESLVSTKKKVTPLCTLKVKNQAINQVSSFNYMGSIISEDARFVKEIHSS